jgi:hypothetical protein
LTTLRWEVPQRADQRISEPNRKELVMRLSATRVEETLTQFEAQPIPDGHPVMEQLKGLFGDHTFFLAANGLNIVEPVERSNSGVQTGKVVNLASWADEGATRLQPHEPETTEVIVEFALEEGPDRTQ